MYIVHLKKNWIVCFKSLETIALSLVFIFFHFIHGLVPIRFTSHEYWGIFRRQKRDRSVKKIEKDLNFLVQKFAILAGISDCPKLSIPHTVKYWKAKGIPELCYFEKSCLKCMNEVVERLIKERRLKSIL